MKFLPKKSSLLGHFVQTALPIFLFFFIQNVLRIVQSPFFNKNVEVAICRNLGLSNLWHIKAWFKKKKPNGYMQRCLSNFLSSPSLSSPLNPFFFLLLSPHVISHSREERILPFFFFLTLFSFFPWFSLKIKRRSGANHLNQWKHDLGANDAHKGEKWSSH